MTDAAAAAPTRRCRIRSDRRCRSRRSRARAPPRPGPATRSRSSTVETDFDEHAVVEHRRRARRRASARWPSSLPRRRRPPRRPSAASRASAPARTPRSVGAGEVAVVTGDDQHVGHVRGERVEAGRVAVGDADEARLSRARRARRATRGRAAWSRRGRARGRARRRRRSRVPSTTWRSSYAPFAAGGFASRCARRSNAASRTVGRARRAGCSADSRSWTRLARVELPRIVEPQHARARRRPRRAAAPPSASRTPSLDAALGDDRDRHRRRAGRRRRTARSTSMNCCSCLFCVASALLFALRCGVLLAHAA